MTDILFALSKILWFPARPGHFALIVGFVGLVSVSETFATPSFVMLSVMRPLMR